MHIGWRLWLASLYWCCSTSYHVVKVRRFTLQNLNHTTGKIEALTHWSCWNGEIILLVLWWAITVQQCSIDVPWRRVVQTMFEAIRNCYYCKAHGSGRCHGHRPSCTAGRECGVLPLPVCCNCDSTLALSKRKVVAKWRKIKQVYAADGTHVFRMPLKDFKARWCAVVIASAAAVSTKNICQLWVLCRGTGAGTLCTECFLVIFAAGICSWVKRKTTKKPALVVTWRSLPCSGFHPEYCRTPSPPPCQSFFWILFVVIVYVIQSSVQNVHGREIRGHEIGSPGCWMRCSYY